MVKLVSMHAGYSQRARSGSPGGLRRYSFSDVEACYRSRQLSKDHLFVGGQLSADAELLVAYLNSRAEMIEHHIEPNLMNREQAREVFETLRSSMPDAGCSLPMNKQRGEKQHHAYLTCIVNLITERELQGRAFEDSPRGPVTVTIDSRPTRTLSRWMDGAYPGLNNPTACWEIKEYYGTTTFGSRVADGVYESMLDGAELEELRDNTSVDVLHYLIVDDRFTWWDKGRSYLCRIVDMLHSGLVDEALFGREVLTEWPRVVRSWIV